MAYLPQQPINVGFFIPTTSIFEIQNIASVDIFSPDFKDLIVQLYQNINNIANAVNAKDTGLYNLQEFVTGSTYFNPNSPNPLDARSVFRSTYNIGALNAGVTNAPHGLTIGTTWQFVRIYGCASNTATNNYYPLPFASAGGANNIELRANATNIVITNNSGVVFTSATVVLEYLKF